jgi:hypothetical protein
VKLNNHSKICKILETNEELNMNASPVTKIRGAASENKTSGNGSSMDA